MKILLYRLLDAFASAWNQSGKALRERRRWGLLWKNMTRSGRTYSRVEFVESTNPEMDGFFVLRPEPGWAWTCPNCKSFSLVTESMMPEILAEWSKMAESCKARGLKIQIPTKPTAATAGCTNCKYRPGAPE